MRGKIHQIEALEILDSRGNPTIHCSVMLDDGTVGSASVPSGASTGIHEALELRDGDKKRYRGKGVLKAIDNIKKEIQPALKGHNVFDLKGIDTTMRLLDGTSNKHRLGANAILAVSLACLHAGAHKAQLPLFEYIRFLYAEDLGDDYRLPKPLMNIFNGGAHADTNLDMQEFIIIPHAFRSFKKRLQVGTEIFHELGKVLREVGLDTDVGNEGGYGPDVGKTEQALEYIAAATKRAGYKLDKQIHFGIDVAASEFYDSRVNRYILQTDRRRLTAKRMVDLLEKWVDKYPLRSIEDPLDQDAFEDWAECMKRMKKKNVMVIGDDFYVTNPRRIRKGVEMGATNAVLIKMNQIGTFSETMEAIGLAQKAGQKIVISHRSGETTDSTIADLAVAVNAEFIKTGAPSRSERLVKYNRLLEIEYLLNSERN